MPTLSEAVLPALATLVSFAPIMFLYLALLRLLHPIEREPSPASKQPRDRGRNYSSFERYTLMSVVDGRSCLQLLHHSTPAIYATSGLCNFLGLSRQASPGLGQMVHPSQRLGFEANHSLWHLTATLSKGSFAGRSFHPCV